MIFDLVTSGCRTDLIALSIIDNLGNSRKGGDSKKYPPSPAPSNIHQICEKETLDSTPGRIVAMSAAQPSAPGLNVIALISGGKDSLYSILHCIRNGHKVVALANLYPEPRNKTASASPNQRKYDEEEDIDSFMYQTIGHSVILSTKQPSKFPLPPTHHRRRSRHSPYLWNQGHRQRRDRVSHPASSSHKTGSSRNQRRICRRHPFYLSAHANRERR